MVGIILFGGTGSIGSQTLEIIKNNQDKLKLIAFTYHKNIKLAKQIANEFNPKIIGYSFENDKNEFNNKILINNNYPEQIINKAKEITNLPLIFINAVTGSAGLKPSYEIIKAKHNLLLANKESLILAGSIIMNLAKENNVKIIPIDSEHSGLYRLLKNNNDEIKNLIITASGGALRNIELEKLNEIKATEALKHPNWQMGKVITINCATMVNKAYEVLEASYLFNLPIEKIKVLIHKESIIHAMVEYNDGSINANLGINSMIIPIAYAIKEELNNQNLKGINLNNLPNLNLSMISNLHLEEVDNNRYPCLNLLLENLKKESYYPTLINAANEICVNAYLEDKIKYQDIYKIIKNTINNYNNYNITKEKLTIENILKLDQEIRKDVIKWIG